jgi:hypothetical protein
VFLPPGRHDEASHFAFVQHTPLLSSHQLPSFGLR